MSIFQTFQFGYEKEAINLRNVSLEFTSMFFCHNIISFDRLDNMDHPFPIPYLAVLNKVEVNTSQSHLTLHEHILNCVKGIGT